MVSLHSQLDSGIVSHTSYTHKPFPIDFGKPRYGNPKETNYVTDLKDCIRLKNSAAGDFIKRHTLNRAENSILSGTESNVSLPGKTQLNTSPEFRTLLKRS